MQLLTHCTLSDDSWPIQAVGTIHSYWYGPNTTYLSHIDIDGVKIRQVFAEIQQILDPCDHLPAAHSRLLLIQSRTGELSIHINMNRIIRIRFISILTASKSVRYSLRKSEYQTWMGSCQINRFFCTNMEKGEFPLTNLNGTFCMTLTDNNSNFLML